MTEARDANAVDLSRPDASSVLTARLTANGAGVVGDQILFRIHTSDSSRDVGTVTTGGDGTSQVDLKNQPIEAVRAIATAKSWEAIFSGDGTYCSSSGKGAFHIVRTP